jgi:hypothetical protein
VIGSRRSTIVTHVSENKTHACPVCQWVIEQDHDEAIAMHAGSLPEEYDAERIAKTVESDRIDFELSSDCDFVIVGPNDTLPYHSGRNQ